MGDVDQRRYERLLDDMARSDPPVTIRLKTTSRVQAFIGGMQIRAEPFDAVELDLGAWWPPAGPDAT